LPVREALKAKLKPEDAENYVIALIGSIPSVGIPSDDDNPAEQKQKLETLRDSTRLERRDEPLELSSNPTHNGRGGRVADKALDAAASCALKRAASGPRGTLFYFSRVFAIKPEDKQVTFVTKMGPLEIKCKFSLKEMILHSNLEL
jgi:hypothetical protein